MFNRHILNASFVVCLVFSIIFVNGCATVRKSDFYVELSQDKIPIQVGLYMSPAFRHPFWTDSSYKFPINEDVAAGIVAGAENAIKETFQEVYLIDHAAGSAIFKYGIKAIVIPEIVEPGISLLKRGGFWTEGEFEFVCKWTIYGTDSKVLYMNTFKSLGKDSSFAGYTRFNKAMTLAVRGNYQKFITHMLSTKWWESAYIK